MSDMCAFRAKLSDFILSLAELYTGYTNAKNISEGDHEIIWKNRSFRNRENLHY